MWKPALALFLLLALTYHTYELSYQISQNDIWAIINYPRSSLLTELVFRTAQALSPWQVVLAGIFLTRSWVNLNT